MPAFNKNYMVVSGTFTGTVETVFSVDFKSNDDIDWRTKQDGVWSSKTTVANSSWSLDTAISLAYGMSVTFTRGAKSTYNSGDSWSFIMYEALQLTPYTDVDYDTIEIIERSDKRDLVVISSSSGTVSVIEDFEGTPNLIDSIANIGVIDTIDTCSRNKEIYIAAGQKTPRFLGYTKNQGFEGQGDEFRFIEDKAYEMLDSESFDAKAMDDFVFLRGDATTQGAGRIAVGIVYGESNLYIWNSEDSKVYVFVLGAPALRIRPDPSVTTTVSSNVVINGIAVMTEPQLIGCCNAIECWSIPFSGSNIGQGTNLDRKVDVYGPTDNATIGPVDGENGYGFSDFIIACSHFNLETVGASFDIVLAPTINSMEDIGNACLFKVEDFDDKSTLNNYVNITPFLNYHQHSVANKSCFVTRRQAIAFNWSGFDESEGDNFDPGEKQVTGKTYSTPDTIKAHIDLIQDISLAFGGYDADGENPMIHFTCRIKNWEHFSESGDLDTWYTDYSGNGTAQGQNFSNQVLNRDYGPFWLDSSGKVLAVRWITFVMALASTGSTKCAKLLHLMDWDNQIGFMTSYRGTVSSSTVQGLIDNETSICSHTPNFAVSYSKGIKYLMIGDENTNGLRWGLSAPRPYAVGGVYSRFYTFNTPYSTGGDHTWEGDDNIFVFPNLYSGLYDNLIGELDSESQPAIVKSRLEVDDSTDSKRWAVGDTDYGMDISSSTGFPTTSHRHLLMAAPHPDFGNVGRISDVLLDQDYTTIRTNILGNTSGWIELSTPTVNSLVKWEGPITKKSFYRVSLIYDGYQESTLLSVQTHYSNSASPGFTSGLNLLITINQDWVPPDRVASIAVYRADDPLDTASTPAGLYRFIEEIPLVSFSTDASSGDYTYTVYDTGASQGSYGAINGISETLSNLHIKYTVCAGLNGYMFVGNCNHAKFDSAENFIFRSQPGKYSIFDWSKDFTPIDFVPKAMVGFMGKLYVFGVNKLAIINPETLVVEDDISGIGCIGPKAIQVSPAGLFWFDQNNVYIATPQIKKIGTTILKQESFGWGILSDNVKSSAVSGYDSNRHCFLIYFTDSSDNRVWSYYIATNRWDLWETDYLVYDTVQSSDGHSILLMANGRISKHLGGTNKRDWEFESKKLSFGVDTVKKKVKVIKADATSRSLTGLTYKTNENYSSWQSGSANSDKYFATGVGKAIKIASSDAKLRWLKVRVTGDNSQSGSDVKTKVVGIVYKPKSPK
jgi:hypothetical protein